MQNASTRKKPLANPVRVPNEVCSQAYRCQNALKRRVEKEKDEMLP